MPGIALACSTVAALLLVLARATWAVGPVCGGPTGSQSPTATDALFVLRASVGQQTCMPCICDVDSSGQVAATDALIVLKAAVGHDVLLDCEPCTDPPAATLVPIPDFDEHDGTDVHPYGGDPGAGGALVVDHTTGRVVSWDFDENFGVFIGPNDRILPAALGGLAGTTTSAWTAARDAASIAVTNGTASSPGDVFVHDGSCPTAAAIKIGVAGHGARRIRCLPPVCAVTNTASGTLTIVSWDGDTTAEITATTPVGGEPIGLDLLAVAGEILVASTGSSDDTYTVTHVSISDGSVVSTVTAPAPPGCSHPHDALWLGDGRRTLILTCSGSDSLALIPTNAP